MCHIYVTVETMKMLNLDLSRTHARSPGSSLTTAIVPATANRVPALDRVKGAGTSPLSGAR